MSARDELESNILAGNLDCPGCIRIAIDTMLSEHAHALAEKLRAIADDGMPGEVSPLWAAGMLDAAATIDPGVES